MSNAKKDEATMVFEVDLIVDHHPDCPDHPNNAVRTSSSGPAKVNSAAYRNNFDGIFGKVTVGDA